MNLHFKLLFFLNIHTIILKFRKGKFLSLSKQLYRRKILLKVINTKLYRKLSWRYPLMKKVLLLCASPRKKSNTMEVVEECANKIEDNGLETEIISLRKMKIQSCQACLKCTKTHQCKIDDGLNEIIEKIKESEGLIVASPVYFGTARGGIMSALQRIGMISRGGDQFLSWKVGGPIAVARRGGHTATLQEMLMFYLINDMIVPGSTYWNMVFGWQPGEVGDDAEGMETIRHFGENVAQLIKKIKK
jgi:multimeric flavodoxin WrbA